ncbi:unnamed protein product [Amoebophrya sp. A25]|nr:unnamed protein product [Amoebophrya sp. A25]|eukprot:GSA25T00016262001.1
MPRPPNKEFMPRRPPTLRFVRFMGTRGTLCRAQTQKVSDLYIDFEGILEAQYNSVFTDGDTIWDGRGYTFYSGDGRPLRGDDLLEDVSDGATVVLFWAFNRAPTDSVHYDPPQFLPPGCREVEVWENMEHLPENASEKAHRIRRQRLATRIGEVRASVYDHAQRLERIQRRNNFVRSTRFEEHGLELARTERDRMREDDILWKFEGKYSGSCIPEAERARLLTFFGLEPPGDSRSSMQVPVYYAEPSGAGQIAGGRMDPSYSATFVHGAVEADHYRGATRTSSSSGAMLRDQIGELRRDLSRHEDGCYRINQQVEPQYAASGSASSNMQTRGSTSSRKAFAPGSRLKDPGGCVDGPGQAMSEGRSSKRPTVPTSEGHRRSAVPVKQVEAPHAEPVKHEKFAPPSRGGKRRR